MPKLKIARIPSTPQEFHFDLIKEGNAALLVAVDRDTGTKLEYGYILGINQSGVHRYRYLNAAIPVERDECDSDAIKDGVVG